MRISRSDLNRYRSALDRLGQSASSRVNAALADARTTSRNEMRALAIDAITEAVGVEGDMAQALAGQLFDEICAAEGMEADAALVFDDLIDPLMMSKKVYYHSGRLRDGDESGFMEACGRLASFYVERCAYESMMRNCGLNDVRFARVPTSGNPCDWCVMLASRGFIYYSEATALAGKHEHCSCIVIPGQAGVTAIEGYDPDAYYDMWRKSGFMPPKGDHEHRIVYPATGANAIRGRSQSARRSNDRQRGLQPQDRTAMFRTLNEAAERGRDALDAAYESVIGQLMAADSVTDADWQDMGDHYVYLLEEMHKKKGRK